MPCSVTSYKLNFIKLLKNSQWRLAQNMAPVKNWCHANRTLSTKCSHKRVTLVQNWHYAKLILRAKVMLCKFNREGIDPMEIYSGWKRFGLECIRSKLVLAGIVRMRNDSSGNWSVANSARVGTHWFSIISTSFVKS